MSSYTMTLLALLGALIAQSWATGLATERFLRKYVESPGHPQGTFTFYIARKK